MNRILLSIFTVGLCFAVGQALKCYKCDVGFWNMCYTTEVNCNAGEYCFSGVGHAIKIVDIKMKGCLKLDECNKTTTTNFPSDSNHTVYNLTKSCCDKDLCNAAPDLHRMSILPLALATLTTAFMTKVLV
ncbi:sperm acrosome membrane-associated protein 4 [Coregonus clupeaformis]|uniref:sperm acrosome membrane-associated protein 4 n=1 Tax=Coregonus clupeaformis TaxID=59861 RepID=UPI001BDF81DF|nr:sperm acrosome membrane-associated protein 4 [Coregonus clupeaformis]